MTAITERLTTALAGRYRLERHIGEGGMATVYLAEDLKYKRKVALKVLRPELAAILGAERFLKEIELTANLHPRLHLRQQGVIAPSSCAVPRTSPARRSDPLSSSYSWS